MPILHTIDSEKGIVLSTWVGEITDADLVESYQKHFEDEQWEPGFSSIVDLRTAVLNSVTDDGLFALFKLVRSYTEGECDGFASVIIASDDLARELTEKFDSFSSDQFHTIEIFDDIQEAYKFLRKL
ncbi:MAG: hypothetical protein D6B28_10540 [Gammaproteobacteria bacterium]|nr:MAG: hypothetical protein D6B28_10540 [Gammaproteobacteria bacterium]